MSHKPQVLHLNWEYAQNCIEKDHEIHLHDSELQNNYIPPFIVCALFHYTNSMAGYGTKWRLISAEDIFILLKLEKQVHKHLWFAIVEL